MARRLLAGARYEAGHAYTDFVEGDFPLFFAPVEGAYYEEYLGWAVHYYARRSFPVLQVVWPDAAARFPFERGFEERYRSQQPLLFDAAASKRAVPDGKGEG